VCSRGPCPCSDHGPRPSLLWPEGISMQAPNNTSSNTELNNDGDTSSGVRGPPRNAVRSKSSSSAGKSVSTSLQPAFMPYIASVPLRTCPHTASVPLRTCTAGTDSDDEASGATGKHATEQHVFDGSTSNGSTAMMDKCPRQARLAGEAKEAKCPWQDVGSGSASRSSPRASSSRQLKYYTMEEVALHNSRDDCWLVAHGRVYDVTSFVALHPAGPNAILKHAGTESTRDFDFHSYAARKMWKAYLIGYVDTGQSNCTVS